MEKLNLVLTSLITEKRLKIHPETTEWQTRKRIDLFLSSLKSLENLPIERAAFYLEFDESTKIYKNLIHSQIRKFPFKSEINSFRFEKYLHWKEHSDSIKNQSALILLLTYDDHIFIDKNNDEINFLTSNLRKIETHLEQPVYASISHFPETHGLITFAKAMGRYHVINSIPVVPCVIPIGAVIISPAIYNQWWEKDFTEGKKIVSPENPFGPSIMNENAWQIFPRNEIFRHLDGYSHVRISSRPYGVLKPNYLTVSSSEFVYSPYFISDQVKLIKSKNNYDLILVGNDPRQELIKDIIFANQLRISLESIKYIATKFPLYYSKLNLVLYQILLSNNKKLLFQTCIELPTIFVLRAYFFSKKILKKNYSINDMRFASMFSSHKTTRFIRLFLLDKLKRVYRQKFSQIPR
jgi:hypothetical protein